MTWCDVVPFLDCAEPAREVVRAVPEITFSALVSAVAFVGGVLAIAVDRPHEARAIPASGAMGEPDAVSLCSEESHPHSSTEGRP